MSAQPQPQSFKPAKPIKRAEPLRYTHSLQVRINDEQIAALRLSAAEEGLSMSSRARQILDDILRAEHPDFFTEPKS